MSPEQRRGALQRGALQRAPGRGPAMRGAPPPRRPR
jgi:hypothetical protein